MERRNTTDPRQYAGTFWLALLALADCSDDNSPASAEAASNTEDTHLHWAPAITFSGGEGDDLLMVAIATTRYPVEMATTRYPVEMATTRSCCRAHL